MAKFGCSLQPKDLFGTFDTTILGSLGSFKGQLKQHQTKNHCQENIWDNFSSLESTAVFCPITPTVIYCGAISDILQYKYFELTFHFEQFFFNFCHNVAVLCRQQTCPGTFDLQSETFIWRSKRVQNLIVAHSTTRDFTVQNILNQLSISEPFFNFWHNVAVLRRQQTCPGTFDLQSGTLSKAQLELETYIHSTFMPSFTAVI